MLTIGAFPITLPERMIAAMSLSLNWAWKSTSADAES
jgi:hypothetical protein